MTAICETLRMHEVGEEFPRSREDGPGGEERVILGGKHGDRPPKTPKLFLARHPGRAGIEPDAPVDRPELPNREVFGFAQYRPRRTQQALPGGPQAVEEHGQGYL